MSFIRVATLFVRQLLEVEVDGYYFTFRSKQFRDIVICGSVTGIKTVEEKSAEFVILTVDDTTACIPCVVSESKNSENSDQYSEISGWRLGAALGLQDSANKMVQMTAHTFQDLQSRNDHEKLKVGDDVRLSGILKQETDFRFVVVERIEKVKNSLEKIANFREFLRFYEVMDELR